MPLIIIIQSNITQIKEIEIIADTKLNVELGEESNLLQEVVITSERKDENVKNTNNLLPAVSGENVIHFSAIPWLDFTSISHARSFSHPDSCPKISFGKMTENNGVKEMSVSIHVHHALMDGYHVGLFVEKFQALLNDE